MVRLRAFSHLLMSWRFLLCTALGLVFLGCDPVREDRRIEFTASGDQVAFQHGSDGIFVADPKSGELHKVFDPDPSVIAVSTPNWSDDETRAIFTTARDATRPEAAAGSATTADRPTNGTTPASSAALPPAWEDAPTGRLFVAQRIVYTCWLVERKENGISKPVRLFDARCEHAGYVAANLAVRWDAKGKRVFFIERDAPLTHAVWVYDMESEHKRRLFPPNGQMTGHVVFDLLGDGRHIVCVASGADTGSSLSAAAETKPGEHHPATANGSKPPSSVSGIWLGSVEETDWWHIPESRHSEWDNAPEGLSTLIAHRPVCSKDGNQLAFVGGEKRVKDSFVASLFRADVKDKKVERVFATSGDIHNLHWSPDGVRLGFVLVEPKTSSLHVVDAHGQLQKPLGDRFVREFAGWNATGDKLAVVSEKASVDIFATRFDLLIPNPRAHDTVVIADAKGAERTILSGLQFTFPQWSPKRDQLSMWGTYQPSHLALTSEMAGGLGLGIGLRRGDPAAIVDVSTGSIRWLAINGDEMAQVGHYYLSKHDPAQAREWYRKADKQLPKLEPLHLDDLIHGLSGSAARRRTFEFFYYLCLSQLNESQEAAQRLAFFDGAHRIDWPAAPSSSTVPKSAKTAAPASNPSVKAGPFWPVESRREAEKLVAIAKALSIAQIFQSIDQPDAAQTWFSHRFATVDANEKLADVTALSQLCLLAKRNQEFATLATDRLAPLLLSALDDPPTDGNAQPDSPLAVRTTLAVLAAHSFGPLFDEGFLKDLPPDFVGQLVPKWEALRFQSHGRLANLCVNLFLHAAASRLGNDKERMAAKAQIARNPFSAPGALSGGLEVYFLWLRPQAQPQRSGQL